MAERPIPQSRRFHAPLDSMDTATQTVGCRHTSPDICAKNSMNTVCAFVRSDGMCLAPPLRWPKQYQKLLQMQTKGGDLDISMTPPKAPTT